MEKRHLISPICLMFAALATLKAFPFEANTVLMQSTYKIEGMGENAMTITGTVFIIGRPLKQDSSRYATVMVTAAHLFDQITSDSCIIYFRKKKGDEYEKYPHSIAIREKGKELFVRHQDPEVDVAAMYIEIPDSVDIKAFTTKWLASDSTLEKHGIHPGDELFCLGFPFGAESNSFGFPILRSGRIASYPLVPASSIRAFLLDFQVFEGNSGGPVYFAYSPKDPPNVITVGGDIFFIAGLVSSQKFISRRMTGIFGSTLEKYPLSLGVIIPAAFIEETIKLLPEIEISGQ